MNPPGDEFVLLRRYAEQRDEAAFATIVRRYLDLVYSAAARRVGERTLAEDVTQAVFLILAQKAKSIREGTVLSAWLLKTVRYCSANALKIEARRRKHEAAAATNRALGMASANPMDVLVWQEAAGRLDDAVLKLPAVDRQAVLMRYFENRPIVEIAANLNVTEGAIKQRLNRAIEKLRNRLNRSGISLPSVGGADLGMWLTTHAVRAAPAGITTSTLAVATGGGAVGGSGFTIAKGAMTMMKLTQIKIAAAILVVAVLTGTGTVMTIKRGFAQDHASSQASAVDQSAAHNDASSLAKNQQEQIDTLSQAADLATQMFTHGVGSSADIDRFNQMLMEVKLRKAASAAERLAVLHDALATAKSAELLASQQASAGVATPLVPMEAKAYRLSIEEKLLEESK